jgi:hypothetical protein
MSLSKLIFITWAQQEEGAGMLSSCGQAVDWRWKVTSKAQQAREGHTVKAR